MRLTADEIAERAEALVAMESPCRLCPRLCGARRADGETGYCGADLVPRVASAGPHFGEESVLVGRGGSGTVFFSHCNLLCDFCQNYDISHLAHGRPTSREDLASAFHELARIGCENVNLVTPTHYVSRIVPALALAARDGFDLPVVYNCGGYESVDALRLLDGIVDIYMPDAKFGDGSRASELCDAPDYPEIMVAALREMQRQVGDLAVDDHGVAVEGLLIRHLVMPGGLADTGRVLRLIAKEVSPSAVVNVMDQYRPCGEVVGAEGPLGRRLTPREHRDAISLARDLGLRVLS